MYLVALKDELTESKIISALDAINELTPIIVPTTGTDSIIAPATDRMIVVPLA